MYLLEVVSFNFQNLKFLDVNFDSTFSHVLKTTEKNYDKVEKFYLR